MTAYKTRAPSPVGMDMAISWYMRPPSAPAFLISPSSRCNRLAACRVQLAQRIRYVTV
jgi:hypothetical protein